MEKIHRQFGKCRLGCGKLFPVDEFWECGLCREVPRYCDSIGPSCAWEHVEVIHPDWSHKEMDLSQ